MLRHLTLLTSLLSVLRTTKRRSTALRHGTSIDVAQVQPTRVSLHLALTHYRNVSTHVTRMVNLLSWQLVCKPYEVHKLGGGGGSWTSGCSLFSAWAAFSRGIGCTLLCCPVGTSGSLVLGSRLGRHQLDGTDTELGTNDDTAKCQHLLPCGGTE
jgi:hypothetical protein